MQWTIPELPQRALVTLVIACVAAAIVGIAQSSKRPNLNAFPTVGSSGWIGSWWGAIKFMTNAADITREGYRKYKGAPFKIATLHRWAVVVCNCAHIDELRNAREDDFLFVEPALEDLNPGFMMGSDPEVFHNPHHVTAIRSHLTRNLEVLFPEVRDEITTAFDEILDLEDNGDMFPMIKNNKSLKLDKGWKIVTALSTIQQVVSRACNRAFVGLPLCRDRDFTVLNIQYTMEIVKPGGIAMGFFPNFLKPLVARFDTAVRRYIAQGVDHLRPVIEERRKCLNEYGRNWSEKPRDLLSWVMDEAGPDASVESLTHHMLLANASVIQTSPSVFANALFNLAANPQYVQPLREEVEIIIEREGWSRTSVGKMRKVDSFLKETIRMEDMSVLTVKRKANKDYTFSDGTLIPKGTRVYAALVAIHGNETLYENPEVFDGFRFAGMGEKGGDSAKLQFAVTSPEYLSFGHGRHACPGRFFAAVALKTMLAHIVTTYDIKLESTTRPRSLQVGPSNKANPTAKLMFRKRIRRDGLEY